MPECNESEFVCHACGGVYDLTEVTYADDDWRQNMYCPDCVETCDICLGDYACLDDHQENYCVVCSRSTCRETTYCDECDCSRCDFHGGCGCNDARIHAYNYRPSSFRPKGNYPTEALLGIEIEVAAEDQSDVLYAVHRVDDCEHHLYVKRDGSITGAEIVSHPATLAYWREFDLESLAARLRDYGCGTDCTCSHHSQYDEECEEYGIHVHVSRRAFRSAAHRALWLLWIHSVADDIIRTVARRESEQWADWRMPTRAYGGRVPLKALASGPVDAHRYLAVNVRNERTYEVRAFKSSLDAREIRACLELVDASVRFTASSDAAAFIAGRMSWRAFNRWAAAAADNIYSNMLAVIAAADGTVVR